MSLDVDGWIAWAEPFAYGVMALKPWEFERIPSTRVFGLMLDGAIRRHQLVEDLAGYIRLDTLLAQGVTFSESGEPPKPGAPTFQRIVGRYPAPLAGPIPTDGDIDGTPESDKAERARAMITAALLERTAFVTPLEPGEEP